MVPKEAIGTGVLLEVFMAGMLSGRILKGAGGGMLLLLDASADADRGKMGLCGAALAGFLANTVTR